MTDTPTTLAFDGKCGLGQALGKDAAGNAAVTREVDGQTVSFMGAGAKTVSYLFTGKIKKMLAAQA